MTDVQTTIPPCPSCGKSDSIDLDDGSRLCLQCRHEWNPGKEVWAGLIGNPPPVADQYQRGDVNQILHAPTVYDVLGPPTVPFDGGETLPLTGGKMLEDSWDWSGKWCRNEGGDTFLVIEDIGNGIVYGQDAAGEEYQMHKDRLSYLGDEPVGPGEVIHESTTGEGEPIIPAILAVAGLALTIGVEAAGETEDDPMGQVRIGWLPPPANDVPEAEQGVGYAIGLLIRIFGIDRAEVRKLAANLLTGAESGTETEG